MEQILVLGGGAAGIAAAISAAESAPAGTKVVLIEQNPRIGKKLLATGNGRCNLDNTGISPERYFSSDPQTMARMLGSMEDPLQWFHSHGLLTRTDPEGRVYPYSNQATDFLNLLLYWLERLGVEIKVNCSVKSITQKNGSYRVETDQGQFTARSVICAFGGQAGPQFGTNGFGCELMKSLGLHVQSEYPCLVATQCDKPRPSGLAGIRAKAAVTLTDGEKFIAREEGEVQFTDQGLSGIVIMQLSNYLKPKGGPRRPILHIDLFPSCTEQELVNILRQRIKLMPGATAEELMTGFIHKRIGIAVWKATRLPGRLSPSDLPTLARTFKDWQFAGLTPLGWQQAQTTGGGMTLSQVDEESFMVRSMPDLYVVGETLDAAGSCGGFNLHWAFGSGITAGRHAATHLPSANHKKR